jgi:K+-sensing histidine kinase KdpD
VLVAVFFLFSLGAKAAAGPFGFLFLILPVLLASILFDRGSGFLATALGVLALASQLDWQANPTGHLVALTIFAIVALFIAVSREALRSALERGLAAQQELQLLLHEQRHRIKNDLALASSLTALQARSQSSPSVRAALESAIARLHVIAQTQDHLQFATGDQSVNMQEYLGLSIDTDPSISRRIAPTPLGANRTTNANMLSLCCEFLKRPQGRWFQRFG